MKINPKYLLIGTVIVVLLIVGGAYKFAYEPNVEKAEQIQKSTKSLIARRDELNAKMANKTMYTEGIEVSKDKAKAVFEKYGPGNTPEKTIMMIVDLCSITGVRINTISFSDDQPIYTSTTADENGNPVYVLKKSQTNISVAGGYTQIKKFFDYVNSYKERMNVENFNLTYALETGMINASVVLNLYAVADSDHVYEAPVVEDIDIGTTNIFRNFFAIQYDEEGNPILPTEEGENAEGENIEGTAGTEGETVTNNPVE